MTLLTPEEFLKAKQDELNRSLNQDEQKEFDRIMKLFEDSINGAINSNFKYPIVYRYTVNPVGLTYIGKNNVNCAINYELLKFGWVLQDGHDYGSIFELRPISEPKTR